MSPITHLWQSTVCAGVAAVAAIALGRAPARIRYNIWLAASLKFLLPLGLLAPIGRYAAAWIAPLTVGAGSSGPGRWLTVATDPVGAGANLAIERAVLGALFVVWAMGAAAFAIRRWKEWRQVSRIIRRGRRLEHGREWNALQHAPRSAVRPASIPMLQIEAPIEPGVFGALRPALLWPAGLSDRLSDDELQTIVAHEAAHVDRRDNLAALTHAVVETIFWFNPIVWWIGAQLVNERERACDEAVIVTSADTRSYAEGILKVCGFCLRSPAAFVAGVGSSNLRDRIEWILNGPRPAPLSTLARMVLAGLVIATAAAPIAAGVLTAEQDSSQTYRLKDEGVTTPRVVREVKPNYTKAALDKRIEGAVSLTAVVLADGTVGDVEVVKSLDKEYGLDDEAVKAVKQWTFDPGKKDGKAVKVRVDIEMSFRLKQ
jgi:TonB family protein